MAALTPLATVEDLVSTIEKSGLLSAETMAKVREAAAKTTDPKRLARDLIKDGSLTKWQATQLLHSYSSLMMGKYELLDQLASGETWRVYLVEHAQMRRKHLLKVLAKKHAAHPELVKRFLAEGRQACALEHPNISRVYDVNRDGDHYFVVMEHIEGDDLQKLVEQQGALSPAEAIEFVHQAAEGLAYAHEHDLVHGDLKPANLLLDATGTIKILDVGQAQLAESTAGPVNRASDIHALGSVLCFLLTGKSIASASEAAEPLKQVPGLSTDLTALTVRLLAENPADRPESMKALLEQLDTLSPIDAGSPKTKSNPAAEPAAKTKSGAIPIAKRLEQAAEESPAASGGFAIQTANRGPKKPLKAPMPAAPQPKSKPAAAKAAAKVEVEEVEPAEVQFDEASPAISKDAKSNSKLIIAGAIGGGGVLALCGVIALGFAFFSGRGEKQVAQNKAVAAKPAVTTPAPQPAAEVNPLANPEANPEVNPTVEASTTPATPTNPMPQAPADAAKPAASAAPPAPSAASPSPAPAAPVPAPKAEGDAAKTEKKPEAKTEAKPAAKTEAKAAVPPAPKTEPPKGPPKPDPRANPFYGFVKEVALPELPLMGEPTSDVLAAVELGPCKVDDKTPIAIRLLGGETVVRGGQKKFDLQAAAGSAREWGFQLVSADAPALVATLAVEKGKMTFQWTADGAKQAAVASLLCNCALEMRAGTGTITVPLRKPVLATPLNIQVEKSGEDVKWAIPNLPDPKHTLVQVLRVDGVKTYNLEPSAPVNAGDDLTVWMGPDEKSMVVGLKLNTSATARGVDVKTVPQIKLAGAPRPQPYRKKEMGDTLKRASQELTFKIGKSAEADKQPASKDANVKKQQDQFKAQLKADVAVLQPQVDQLAQLTTFIGEAQTGGKVHFRVYYKSNDAEVDLLYTDADRKPGTPTVPGAAKVDDKAKK